MTVPTEKPVPSNAWLPRKDWLWLVAVMLTGTLAISSQSFWMDEASTATIATQPTLASWWHVLSTGLGSDTQMPLYMIYVWGWVKIFGAAEWVLRASNLPWLLVGFLALPRRQPGFVLALALSPFLWYYLNEARPYVMQISASLLLGGALARLFEMPAVSAVPVRRGEGLWTMLFCCGLVTLSGSSMLGMLWAGAMVLVFPLLLGWSRALHLVRRAWLGCLLTAVSLGGLADYYLWTIHHGNGGTQGATGVANVVFIVYELCGFAGLGPGRGDMHGSGVAAFHAAYLLPLALYALLLLAVVWFGTGPVLRPAPARVWLGLLLPVALMAGCILFLAVIRQNTLLGRHFAPVVIVLLLLLGAGLERLRQAGGWQRTLALVFLGLSLVSAASLRWCERHHKDDYRQAAALAIAAQAQGQRLWWCADGTAGVYYGVPLSPARSPVAVPGKAWLIADPPAAWLASNTIPDLVVLSKPELNDKRGDLRNYLQAHHFVCQQSFSVFKIWAHP